MYAEEYVWKENWNADCIYLLADGRVNYTVNIEDVNGKEKK